MTQHPQHMPGPVGHLAVREAQGRAPRHPVGVLTLVVAVLLRRRPVVAQAVGLYDQPGLGPQEVDSVAVDAAPGLGDREAGSADQVEEAALQLGVGQPERLASSSSRTGRTPG